jgi:DNA-binding LacI/PurR family transcriptional regulator
MKKPVSLKEIAHLAGVSHSTVSRALSNSSLISEEMVARIHRIAAEKGYQPNKNARSLVTRRSRSIGCVVTSIADPFIGEVIFSVEEVALKHDYSIILTNSGADPDREMKAVRSLCERAVDAVLVVASRVGGAYLPYLSERQIPIILINNQHSGDFIHSVATATPEAACEITRHLCSLGHQRIGYIGDRFGGQSDAERFAGYRAALKEAGIRSSPRLVIHGPSTPEGGKQAMKKLLALPHPPTAVFCYDDMVALGAYQAIHQAGLRIPRDISVAGFDDQFFAAYLQPPLTTIRQPMRELGQRAVELCLKLLSTSDASTTPMPARIFIPGYLMVRRSTASPAVQDAPRRLRV